MNEAVVGLRAVAAMLRYALFGAAVVVAIVALVDWAVRTRRLNPFGAVARFFRRTIDPLMVPVERRVVRAGGRPASAPLWALGVVIVGGLLLIALLDVVIGQLSFAIVAVSQGAGGLLALVVGWTFALLRIALIVRVISSWFGMSLYSPWIRWSHILTEWMLAPLRRVIPLVGTVDLSPIVAYFALALLERVLVQALAF